MQPKKTIEILVLIVFLFGLSLFTYSEEKLTVQDLLSPAYFSKIMTPQYIIEKIEIIVIFNIYF